MSAIKGAITGIALGLCFIAGYQLRSYEVKGMGEMYRKIQQHDIELLRKEQEAAAECLDELDRCREEGCD